MVSMENDAIYQEFRDESTELLNSIENDILQIERQKKTFDKPTLEKMFRALHTIKGSSSFLALKNIGKLSHLMEDIFYAIKNDQLSLKGNVIEALFKGLDVLKKLIYRLEDSDSVDISKIAESLANVIHKGCDSQVEAEAFFTSVTIELDEAKRRLRKRHVELDVITELATKIETVLGLLNRNILDQDEKTIEVLRGAVDALKDSLFAGAEAADIPRHIGSLQGVLEQSFLCNVNEVLDKVLELVKFQLSNSNIKVSRDYVEDTKVFVGGESELIMQVFLNVISTLIAENKGELVIKTSVMDDSIVQIQIGNPEYKISRDEIEVILNPESRTKLSLVKKMLKQCGGQIRASNELDEGTTFLIEVSKGSR